MFVISFSGLIQILKMLEFDPFLDRYFVCDCRTRCGRKIVRLIYLFFKIPMLTPAKKIFLLNCEVFRHHFGIDLSHVQLLSKNLMMIKLKFNWSNLTKVFIRSMLSNLKASLNGFHFERVFCLPRNDLCQ